jgi:Flp pilus assembly protein TadD
LKAWHRHFLAALIIVVLAILAYGSSIENDFVHDDNYQIVRNPFLQSDSPWYQLFTTDVWAYTQPGHSGVSNYYRPLQLLTYRWTAEIGGLSPRRFHQVNLAFHILASLAAYWLLLRLSHKPSLALAAAILFVVHPIHSEAVVWIASLPELGCALFFFLSFLLFVMGLAQSRSTSVKKGKKSKTGSEVPWLLYGSLVSFVISLLWKEMALTLPLLVGSYVFLIHTQEFSDLKVRLKTAFVKTLPYWTVVVVYLGWRLFILGFVSKEQHVWRLSSFQFLLNVINLIAKYWWKLIWPAELNAFYLFNPVMSVFEPRLLIALFSLVAILALMICGWKKYPLAVFCSLWIFVTLIPVLNIGGVGTNVFTERYLYIPSLGFCLLISTLYVRWIAPLFPQQAWVASLAFVSVPYTMQCASRNSDWKDDFTFYSKAAEASPNSAAMQNSLAHVWREQKRNLDEAQRLSLNAINLAQSENPPNNREIATGYLNLANVYIERQQFQAAVEAAEKGLQFESSVLGLKIIRGIALLQMGRLAEAEQILTQAYRQSPNNEIILQFLGMVYLSQRRLETAVDYFTRALKILPSYSDAHNNLAATFVELGRYQDAVVHLRRAAELSPGNAMALCNLGIILGKLGHLDEARAQLHRARALAPNDAFIQSQLAQLDQLSVRQTP